MRKIQLVVSLCAAGLAVSACSKKEAAPIVDSAAIAAKADSVTRDSIQSAYARTNDSLAAAAGAAAAAGVPPAASKAGTAGETRKSGDPAGGKIIGRDSMTMPVGTIDENGKVTKIKRD